MISLLDRTVQKIFFNMFLKRTRSYNRSQVNLFNRHNSTQYKMFKKIQMTNQFHSQWRRLKFQVWVNWSVNFSKKISINPRQFKLIQKSLKIIVKSVIKSIYKWHYICLKRRRLYRNNNTIVLIINVHKLQFIL